MLSIRHLQSIGPNTSSFWTQIHAAQEVWTTHSGNSEDLTRGKVLFTNILPQECRRQGFLELGLQKDLSRNLARQYCLDLVFVRVGTSVC